MTGFRALAGPTGAAGGLAGWSAAIAGLVEETPSRSRRSGRRAAPELGGVPPVGQALVHREGAVGRCWRPKGRCEMRGRVRRRSSGCTAIPTASPQVCALQRGPWRPVRRRRVPRELLRRRALRCRLPRRGGCWCRSSTLVPWDPAAAQDLADRRGADAMAESEQLALDPAISPAPAPATSPTSAPGREGRRHVPRSPTGLPARPAGAARSGSARTSR